MQLIEKLPTWIVILP